MSPVWYALRFSRTETINLLLQLCPMWPPLSSVTHDVMTYTELMKGVSQLATHEENPVQQLRATMKNNLKTLKCTVSPIKHTASRVSLCLDWYNSNIPSFPLFWEVWCHVQWLLLCNQTNDEKFALRFNLLRVQWTWTVIFWLLLS